jgi:hypothetical protein
MSLTVGPAFIIAGYTTLAPPDFDAECEAIVYAADGVVGYPAFWSSYRSGPLHDATSPVAMLPVEVPLHDATFTESEAARGGGVVAPATAREPPVRIERSVSSSCRS